MWPLPNHHQASSLYRGHRRSSFRALDDSEVIELRARYRTFFGAYYRTSLMCLAYAASILKIFSQQFYSIGIVFIVLALLILVIAYTRSYRSDKDFSDAAAQGVRTDVIDPNGERIFGRPFRTSGNQVVLLGGLVIGTEIALLVLIMML